MHSVNLLPANLARIHRRRLRALFWSATAMLTIAANALILILGSVILAADTAPLRERLTQVTDDTAAAERRLSSVQIQIAEARAQRLAREAVTAKPVWSPMLASIATDVSQFGILDSIAITPIQAQTGQTTQTTITFEGQTTEAATLPSLLLKLESNPLFDEVVLITSARAAQRPDASGTRFVIESRIGTRGTTP